MNDDRATNAPAAVEPVALPQVPRPPTPRARRRSWAELSVRVWIVLTLTVAIVTAFFTITRVNEALDDRWLIQNGTPVVAKFDTVMGDAVPKQRYRNEPMPVRISFTLNGQTKTLEFNLEPKPGAIASKGMDFKIKVDPNNLDRWTEQTEVRPWSQELTAVGFLLPVLVIVTLIAWLKRRDVLKTWRDGELAEGTVVELRQTPIAPLSRVVRFTLKDGADRRVWATLMPTRAGVPAIGETLSLIHPPNRPGRAIVAKLYQEG